MIKSTWPQYDIDEINIVNKIITSGKVNYWTGKYGKIFEKKFSLFSQVKYALSISNGTHALEIALKSINIKSGDHVIVSSKSFVASASSVLSVNAVPIFSDIDLNSQNITLSNIKDCITNKTKAIILVHLAGMPCEMKEIIIYCKKKNIRVIEDCSQKHGATYYNKSVGS
jgi:Predicted pyridoxal phosphate-dependent enzyme apparently involved in regulation of cell wall biogenesis